MKRFLPVIIMMILILSGCGQQKMFIDTAAMSEIIDGEWKSGDDEFSFTLNIDGDSMIMSMKDKEDEAYAIMLDSDNGYFETDDTKYQVKILDSKYVIESKYCTFEKVE